MDKNPIRRSMGSGVPVGRQAMRLLVAGLGGGNSIIFRIKPV